MNLKRKDRIAIVLSLFGPFIVFIVVAAFMQFLGSIGFIQWLLFIFGAIESTDPYDLYARNFVEEIQKLITYSFLIAAYLVVFTHWLIRFIGTKEDE